MELRPYQTEAVDELLFFYLQQRPESGLCVLPTASGKTIIFAEFIRQLFTLKPASRVLVLSHTQEIVLQNAEKVRQVWPQADVGVYCAGLDRREVKRITSASRDTFIAEVNTYPYWDLVIVDEAHLISPDESSRYQRLLTTLKRANPQVKVIGFTATPFRMKDGHIFGSHASALFDRVVFKKRIDELVNSGYLCPLHAIKVEPAGVADLGQVRITQKDFNATDLAKVTVVERLVSAIVDDWLFKTLGTLPTVFFASSVAQAELFANALNDRGLFYPVITARTKKSERTEMLAQFSEGKIPGLINVATLTTGWDAPHLACIVLARPTLSAGLFLQIIGRGLRLHKSKTETLLLDYGQNLARFGMPERVRPVSENRREFFETEQVKSCPDCESIVSSYELSCPFCTEPLMTEDDISACYVCGAGNDRCAQFCEVCGEQIEENKVLFER